MNYDLSRLGPLEFEDMVQSLWQGHFGMTSSIYGSGPDGQREASFQGKAKVPKNDGEELEGYWVLQAKFKEKNDNKCFNWLRKELTQEIQGFQRKKKENEQAGKEIHIIPEIYLFFTNIVLTPVGQSGLKDKIAQLIKENDYQSIIPHIYVLGYDEITRMLDNNRNVATAYASFILPGDVLSYLYERVTEAERLRHNSLLRYIKNSFISNRRSRMDQQEEIEEAGGRKVYLEKVYTDLDYKGENLSGKFVRDALAIGNRRLCPQNMKNRRGLKEAEWSENLSKRSEYTSRLMNIDGDAEWNAHSFNSNKYIVKGSAGQGKSTVCQFLAQIYRAAFLKDFWTSTDEPDTEDDHRSFLRTIEEEKYELPSCRRIPVFIDLKSYSSWIYERRNGIEEKFCDLVSYIVSQISNGANDNMFVNDTLRLYFKTFSWIFFFDGLDEVPESSNRDQVLREINYFINVELEQANTDAMFFATTRPEGFAGNEFETVRFQQIQLLPLKEDDCYAYLKKLLTLLRGEERTKEPLQTLQGYLYSRGSGADAQIKKMLETPLQARIIALLVMNDGGLPEDKYSLFHNYFEIIIKRERSKKVEDLIRVFDEYAMQIEPCFYILGYTLQNKSAQIGEDAFITRGELVELIGKRLRSQGFSENEIKQDAPLICRLIAERLNIAAEIRAGYIGFPIRSLQEYLTARYLIVMANGKSEKWSVALREMVVSSYWQNTFFLFLEGLYRATNDYLAAQLNGLLTELNEGCPEESGFEKISYGSQVAFVLLINHIFKGTPEYERRLFNILKNGLKNIVSVEELIKITSISMKIKIEWVDEILQKREKFLTDMDFAVVGIFLVGIDEFPQDKKEAIQRFSEKHAQDIVFSIIDIFPFFPYWLTSYAVPLINKGCVLSIDELGVDHILTYVEEADSEQLTEQGEETLFKIALKSFIQEDGWWFRKRFPTRYGVDLDALSKLMVDGFESHEIGCGVNWYYTFPAQVTENELKPLVEIAQRYGLKGLALILSTVCSRNLADYKKFSEEILDYKDEILEYGEERLIKQNNLMLRIWSARCYGRKYGFSLEELLDEASELGKETSKYLKTFPRISTLEEYVCESKKECSLLSFSCNRDISFSDVYEEVLKQVSPEVILSYRNLCLDAAFFYAVSLQTAYMNYGNDSDRNVFQEHVSELMQFFKTALKYSKTWASSFMRYNPWIDVLWQFAFLLIKTPKTWTEFHDFPFRETELFGTASGYETKFSNQDSIAIINGAIDYIRYTENASAYAFLHNFVTQENVDYQCLEEVNWSGLEHMWRIGGGEEKKLQCLAKVVQANDRNHIAQMLKPDGDIYALLQDEGTFEFVWQVLSGKKIPYKLIPFLIYYLDAYRKKSDDATVDKHDVKGKILFLEKKIKDILTAQPINLSSKFDNP